MRSAGGLLDAHAVAVVLVKARARLDTELALRDELGQLSTVRVRAPHENTAQTSVDSMAYNADARKTRRGRDGTGRDGTGRDGMGRDGTGRDGTDHGDRVEERLLRVRLVPAVDDKLGRVQADVVGQLQRAHRVASTELRG